MLKHIVLFESSQWLAKPRFYIYTGVLFLLSYLICIMAGGIFEGLTATVNSLEKINSTQSILGLINGIALIGYLFLPSIAGSIIAKDFETGFHNVFFSYPLSKSKYLVGKFAAAYLVAILITLGIFLGTILGFITPGMDANLIGPHQWKSYLQVGLVYVLPNLLFISVLVFSVCTFTRSIVAGFVTVIVLYVLQGVATSLMNNMDNKVLAALIDPFGENCNSYYTQYWSVFEKNENELPIGNLVIFNRLIWITAAILIGLFVYWKFQFTIIGQESRRRIKMSEVPQPTKYGSLQAIRIPTIGSESGFISTLRTAFSLAKLDVIFLIRNATFLIVCIIAVLLMILMHFSAEVFDTPTLPVTRSILQIPGVTFQFFICLLTFLYSGLLINRPLKTNIFQLEDSTATPNHAFLISKFMSVTIMQIILMLLVVLTGVSLQVYHGYYNFELILYFKELFGLKLVGFVIWTMLSIFIHTLLPGFYAAFFFLLALYMTRSFWDKMGIEQSIYKYNDGPMPWYSDINGYGHSWKIYWIFKLYWLMLGSFFIFSAMAIWRRGVFTGNKERFKIFIDNLKGTTLGVWLASILCFLILGSFLYYETNISKPYISQKKYEALQADYEKNYKYFSFKPHPRIIDINVLIDLFPNEKNIHVAGRYLMVNSDSMPVDTFLITLSDDFLNSQFTFNNEVQLVSKDTLMGSFVYRFERSLAPGDTCVIDFEIANKKNGLVNYSGLVRENGTFIQNRSFLPVIGYDDSFEQTDTKTRKKYGLEAKERMLPPSDTSALNQNYISHDADWINFEATLSTSSDQIAIAPGVLVNEWKETGRNYFQYKMPVKMLNFFNICSGKYTIQEDEWNGIKIKIYYDRKHPYNVNRILEGVKKALEYCSSNFAPYQHPEIRIVEVPYVGYAQSFAMTIPFSENVGFIANVDDNKADQYDYPFLVSAHEVAHQWWGHQVVGANVQGAALMSESLAEYSSLKILEKQYGADKMRRFLKDNLDKYLQGRQTEKKKEQPLIYCENQQYIHYNKGSLVLYNLSDYLGDSILNKALSEYVYKVRYRVPYTTSLEFLKTLESVTPDTLRYYLEDNLSHITLYDNRMINAICTQQADGQYKLELEFQVSKYRSGETGKRIYANLKGDSLVNSRELIKNQVKSFPLNDYIEVGAFVQKIENEKKPERVLFLKKYKFTTIENKLTIVLPEKPDMVGVDPYNKLIDTDSEDNRRAVICK